MNRWWIFWLLAAAFVWLIVSSFAEIKGIAELLIKGNGQWILVAALLQAAYFTVFTVMFWFAFKAVEVKSRINELLPLTFGSQFVNTIAPTWGMGGVALFVDDLSSRGQSPARATAGTILAQISDYVSFAFVLALSLGYLYIQQELKDYEIIGALLMLLVLCGLSISLLLGMFRPTLLVRMLSLAQRGIRSLACRIKHKPLLGDGWASQNANDFIDAAKTIEEHPWRLARTLGTALSAHLINIASIYALFLAYHNPISIGPLIAGYAIGILFWNISPVPQGIGLVEGVMAIAYNSLGVHGTTATVVVLAFRGLDFWLPMLLGFFLLRRAKIFGSMGKKA
ncbi:MAG: lysylphosphatidylglycerol synthase transmembrane domain-containing protein [Methanotrichaceae archaeon]